MHDPKMSEIRLLRESDIAAAMELKDFAGWNQTESDWRLLLKLEPDGCFAALLGDQLVGTTTTTCYGRELAWIGMVLVRPEERRSGVATKLMTTALDYLSQRVATVKLDATPQGKQVYEKLGFQVESHLERWSVVANSTKLVSEASAPATLDAKARRELFALDRCAFNADRSQLLDALIDNASVPPVLTRSGDGLLTGYALSRPGSNAEYVGPVVAMEPEQLGPLLDRMLSQLVSRRVYIDFNTDSNKSGVLLERGFVKERGFIRMCRGKPSTRTLPFVIGIAGPELG